MSPMEQAALDYEQAAHELERATAHLRESAKHMREREVPRACAHALAALGHLKQAEQRVHARAIDHAGRSHLRGEA